MEHDKRDDVLEQDPSRPAGDAPREPSQAVKRVDQADAIYSLETAVRCPQCGEMMSTVKAVRLLRTEVNFTSTLPRRGRVTVCPFCHGVVPSELSNF
jgi:ArsR family metal-binding transcriptional regulator